MRTLMVTLSLAFCVVASGVFADSPRPVKTYRGSVFQPRQFQSLGALALKKGETLTFQTGDAETAPRMSGVKENAGAIGHSRSGRVEVAVFSFDSIDLASGSRVRVEGSRGLVLVSSGEVRIDTTIDVSGENGVHIKAERAQFKPLEEKLEKEGKKDRNWNRTRRWIHTARGGPGGESGERGEKFASAPPKASPYGGGDGGPAMKDNGVSGMGYGAGFNRRVKGGAAGSGGGYGGKGGDSSLASSGGYNQKQRKPMPGGPSYGDEKLTDLVGGSGGAGASNDRKYDSGGGGGGGGALAIVTYRDISLGENARLLARGGDGLTHHIGGGGGSGGAIMLVAKGKIELHKDAVIDASGGDGGKSNGDEEVKAAIDSGKGRLNVGAGGGGGGGRIVFLCANAFRKAPAQVTVAGGKGGQEAEDGGDGSFYSARR